MRGSRDFADLAEYRRFIDEVGGRHNAKHRSRIAIEQPFLQALPRQRTTDYEEVLVDVTSSSGFTLRRVFYTTPSRLIGHRLRARLYDDRVDLYLGSSLQLSLVRARPPGDSHDHVIDYRHIIHSLRRKPMALMGLVYRDKLFPRPAYRRAFDALTLALPDRAACKIVVELLALAHDRVCEAELAERLTKDLDGGILPDLQVLRALFTPDPQALPTVVVINPPLRDYDALATIRLEQAA